MLEVVRSPDGTTSGCRIPPGAPALDLGGYGSIAMRPAGLLNSAYPRRCTNNQTKEVHMIPQRQLDALDAYDTLDDGIRTPGTRRMRCAPRTSARAGS